MNFDLSKFHRACADKSIVSDGVKLYVWCPVCGVLADCEAVAGKVSPADASKIDNKDRIVIGKQSPLINKGGIIE